MRCNYCGSSETLRKSKRMIHDAGQEILTQVYYDIYNCINCSNAKSVFCRICGINSNGSTREWMLSHCVMHWNMGFDIGSYVVGLKVSVMNDTRLWFILDRSKLYYMMLLKGNSRNLVKEVNNYLISLGNDVEYEGVTITGETATRVFSIVKNELLTCIFCGHDYDAPPTELIVLRHVRKCY